MALSFARARWARRTLQRLRPLPQNVFLDLPGRRRRQRPEHDLLRHLEPREAVAAVAHHFVFGSARTGLELDEGTRRLAPLLVRARDDRGERYRRVPVQRDLDLDTRDVLAAGDDDVLLAVLDLDVVVGIPDREVAGVHPAACERFGGRLRVLDVAEHHRVALDQDLADRLPVLRDWLAGPRIGGDGAVDGPVSHALPRHLLGALFDGHLGPRLLRLAQRRRPLELRHPVDVRDAESEL